MTVTAVCGAHRTGIAAAAVRKKESDVLGFWAEESGPFLDKGCMTTPA